MSATSPVWLGGSILVIVYLITLAEHFFANVSAPMQVPCAFFSAFALKKALA